ncbi:hypothetical protein ACFQO4_19285 [Saliphagus sp. GCM10025334]|uniref:hypothetical protein n=1 Tax=Natronosalvus caseinilyticus TaxID=2953747 RepID=UPI0028A8FC72|nr:hypothetical protein [Natronosalvus caseinilyticus]
MSNDNPFGEAMDDAAEEKNRVDQQGSSDFDTEPYYDALNTGVKDHTIGVSVSEEMHQFWRELQDTDDIDVDPAQSIRNHLENLAHRHPDVFERAMRKLEIDREM